MERFSARGGVARIVALGNVLLGDDGFGPLVIERFRAEFECDSEVEVLDLGTPGLDLAPYLQDAGLIVIVDAVRAAGEPGSLHLYSENDLLLNGGPFLRLDAHDPGIFESLVPLRLSDRGPRELLILGAVPESCQLGQRFSPSVLAASSAAVEQLAGMLRARGYACHRRKSQLPANLWWLPIESSAPATPA